MEAENAIQKDEGVLRKVVGVGLEPGGEGQVRTRGCVRV